MTQSQRHQIAVAILTVLGAIAIVAVLHWPWALHHVFQETGSNSSSSRAYNFWSGFGSDFGEVVLIGGLITLVRHHNCHVKGCWALGRPVAGTPYVACHDHHPERTDNGAKRNVTAAEITEHYESNQQ